MNFAVAETGAVVVCTNEGNADMCTSLPGVHIACMGIEKIIPRERDLGVFLRLLARSATSQPVTTYTTHFLGPRAGGELHVGIVDNGRAEILGREAIRESLACIRCGACMNTCPVFRRSGGHSDGYARSPAPAARAAAPLVRALEHLGAGSASCRRCRGAAFARSIGGVVVVSAFTTHFTHFRAATVASRASYQTNGAHRISRRVAKKPAHPRKPFTGCRRRIRRLAHTETARMPAFRGGRFLG